MSAEVAPDGGVAPLTLLGALGGSVTDRTRKLLGAYFLGQQAWRVAKGLYDKDRHRRRYTIAVPGDDQIYDEVHGWLLDRLPSERRKSLLAKSGRSSSSDMVPVSAGESSAAASLRLFYDGKRTQTVEIDGHAVDVEIEKPESGRGGGDDDWRWYKKEERILFTAPSLTARDAVLAFLNEITVQLGKQPPKLYVAQGWGSWDRRSDVPNRTLESVVLRRGQKELLLDDLRTFLAQEADYARLGVPWHRGYLFHGPPGTGKTSVAKALATSLGLDVYYMPLSSLRNDAVLIELLMRVEPRSILLLEDIDVTHATHQSSDAGSFEGVTMQGLVNALDGFITPYGLITMMTTNELAKIDPKVIRPGRADVQVEIGVVDDDQLGDLVEAMLGRRPDLPPLADGAQLTPATVVEAIKSNLGDPDGAIADIRALL